DRRSGLDEARGRRLRVALDRLAIGAVDPLDDEPLRPAVREPRAQILVRRQRPREPRLELEEHEAARRDERPRAGIDVGRELGPRLDPAAREEALDRGDVLLGEAMIRGEATRLVEVAA